MTEITKDTPLVHICEVCGLEKIMTPEESYNEGWDYPPLMGAFGIISPRTCGVCGIDKTLWWRVTTTRDDPDNQYQLTQGDMALIERIQGEPESILARSNDAG